MTLVKMSLSQTSWTISNELMFVVKLNVKEVIEVNGGRGSKIFLLQMLLLLGWLFCGRRVLEI